MVPGRWQALLEMSLEFIAGMTEGSGGKAFGRKVFPLVSGLFIFILIANYTGLLPGVGTIGTEEVVTAELDHDRGKRSDRGIGQHQMAARRSTRPPKRKATTKCWCPSCGRRPLI